MVRISVDYTGNLECEAVHGLSRTKVKTDAPIDNQGRGASFSPTDLVATALGTCILTTMGIAARREKIPLEGSSLTVDKIMSADTPRRVDRLVIAIKLSVPRSADPKNVLEPIARSCPVSRSLHPDIEREVAIEWQPESTE